MFKTNYVAIFLAVLIVSNLIEMKKAIITLKRYLDMFFSYYLPLQFKIFRKICIADMMDIGMVLNTVPPRHFYSWIL